VQDAARPVPTVPSLNSTAEVEPWDYFDEVRRAGDVTWDAEQNAWLVSSYELVKQFAFDDGELWRDPFLPDVEQPPFGLDPEVWREYWGSEKNLSLLDGAAHDVMHRWWMFVFSPRVLTDWAETRIRPVAHALIDRLAGCDRADLSAAYARGVGPRVMTSVLGLNWQDETWPDRLLEVHTQQRALLHFSHEAPTRISKDTVADSLAAAREIKELIRPYVRAGRSGKGDDFIGLVWRSAEELFGPDYNEDDVLSTIVLAFGAGAGTTAAGAANAIYLLLTHPELQDELRGDPELLPAFIEETLRLYGPVVFRPRYAKRDTTLGGVTIRRGELVIGLSASANRDPDHYADAGKIDLHRRAARDHFAFQRGHRACPGQSVARVQLESILGVLLERLEDLRLDPDVEPPRFRELLVRHWAPLHATFRVRA
jgi:cytochrome P450